MKVAIQSFRALFELHGSARECHLPVGFDPHVLDVGDHFAHTFGPRRGPPSGLSCASKAGFTARKR